ncbi:MAG: aminotransferase class I/II-fold pyridoxal phosphate-dependent enzyme [Puniceicoccales bacterium]|jgi:LL-diaminopimelate aminotransferase|nr:aminotransferase class I/II-fold pyridoxal phosphate-dependent enzyme [Puniceicoccales bacterium]
MEMKMNDFHIADRLGGRNFGTFPSYKFAQIQRLKEDFFRSNPSLPLLDFGIGRPTEPPSEVAVAAMNAATATCENHHYADCGCFIFMEAAVRYMERVFSVAMEPERELLPSMGTKNAFTYLALALFNPGDVLLSTAPGYPVFPTHARYLGVQVHAMPLLERNQFLPDFADIPPEALRRAKVLHLNYPNNPTGACAPAEFFSDAVAFARKNHLILVHDAAYAGLHNEQFPPRSVLRVPGAKEVAVELHSCSKAHNMTGWRLGWICGNEKVIAAYREIKMNSDSGQFLPLQMGAIAALDDDCFCQKRMSIYGERFSAAVRVFREKGFLFSSHSHPFYAYGPAPKEVNGIPMDSAAAFCQWLLRQCGVLLTDWDDTGNYLRASMTIPMEAAAMEAELRERLRGYDFSI